jgi:glutamyl-tRNA synthetase
VRVRFAPSPTGFLHVGGARTALFNWLLARQSGGTFVLRIEDTDRARSSDAMTGAILRGLEWLGIDWDEGPHFQSDRVGEHTSAGRKLLAAGQAYRDFSTPEELARDRTNIAAMAGEATRAARRRAEALAPGEAEERAEAGEPHVVRFLVPEGSTEWKDAVHGPMRFRNQDIDDLVILRADDSPTYNLAVVCDDAHARIDMVLRGDDHLSNTPKQILLARALGFPVPRFGHVPLILGRDGKRLSKRHGATDIAEYRRDILPEAMVNFLALLGWSPGDDREVMDLDEIIRRFSLGRILRKGSVFDADKLAWLNGRHLSRMDLARLESLVNVRLAELRPSLETAVQDRPDWFEGLLDMLRARARSMDALARSVSLYLPGEVRYEPAAVRKHWKRRAQVQEYLTALRRSLDGCEWQPEPLERALRGLAAELGVGAGRLIHPLRVALTGQAVSPGIFDVLYYLGRDLSLSRIEEALETLAEGEAELQAGTSRIAPA